VEVDSDIVTMIPKVLGMYRHAGVQVVIDSDEAGKNCFILLFYLFHFLIVFASVVYCFCFAF
jgi:hypothetical protein